MLIKSPFLLGENFRKLICWIFLVCFLLSTSFYILGIELYFTILFDAFIFSSLIFFKTSRKGTFILLGLGSYLFYHLAYVYINFGTTHFRDLFLSIKFVLYFIILISIYRRQLLSAELFSKYFNVLLFMFLIKYVIARALGDSRPPLFTENNFEMCFLSVLYITYVYVNGSSKLKFFLLLIVVVLSGSRSAILGLLIIYIYQFKPFSSINLYQFIRLLSLGVVGFIVILVVLSRMGSSGLEGVDRYIFLLVFIDNIYDWGVKEFLFGNSPLTPLKAGSCQQLSFYQSLFSRSSEGVCYPVILHLFWFRVILEHGVVIVILSSLLIFYVLRQKGFNTRYALFCIALISVNGLSVSAYSSSIIFFSLVIISLLNRLPKKSALSGL